uniref:G protein-coupled receptor n=1 Tax=Panagrolaimus sp. PS1159 TaxID=55785 RepID=A0AC35GN15_9BILA
MSFLFLWPSEKVYAEKAKLLEADIYYYKDHLIFVTGDIRKWYTCIQAIYASFLTNISYIIVSWTSFKVWKHLNVMRSNMSTQTMDIHKQMTKALIMQAVIPFLICLLPIGITIIMVIFRASIDGLGIGISLILSWIPIINSATTIFVVKQYRRIIIGFFKRIICLKSERYTSTIPYATTNQITNNNKISQA